MSLRAGVNRVLTKTTGYRLVRAAPPAPAPARRSMPADYDQNAREIWELVRDRTMTGHPKVHFLTEAVRYVVRCGVPGAMLECGVWRGGSMLTVAHMLLRLGVTDRDLYLFDTFTGMTEPTERDQHVFAGRSAEAMLAARTGAPIWQPATLEDVQAGFTGMDYPAERLHFVPGKVEDTIPEAAPDQIAILRLDTDWYESTKHEFTHLYHRLAPGGVLIIDDYGSWQGSKDATDEFLDETGEPLLLVRVGRGRVAVKPGLKSTV
ncbi:MAG TPA: TylF/MycF/NovP-related O-methyltransferase [Marmoricola sp.]|nr:TylF/MycF/NovP-related O-methyltransferase [Marmoricola sp.]